MGKKESRNNSLSKWKIRYYNFEKQVVLSFFIIIYYIKRPLYIKDAEVNKFTYFISQTLFILHFLFILIYHHFRPYKEYIVLIVQEFYHVLVLKEPSWQSENI